jgi:hypothetical protein
MAAENCSVGQFETTAGEFYYVVDCPLTGRPFPFGHDPSHGRASFPAGPLFVRCPCCQKCHEIAEPQVSSLKALKKS